MTDENNYPQSGIISIADTATFLGVSEMTVRRMCDMNVLRCFRLGVKRLIPAGEPQAFLDRIMQQEAASPEAYLNSPHITSNPKSPRYVPPETEDA